MRWRALWLLAIGSAVVAAPFAGSVGASPPRTAARARKSVHVTIPLPAPGHARVSIVTITVRSQKRGAVGTLDVKATNASQVLQAHADAVAAIWPPSTKKRKAKFKVYVIMYRGNLGAASGRASEASTPALGMNFFLTGPFAMGAVDEVTDDASCAEAEPEFTDHGPLTERLRSLVTESPIKPEEQRDQDISALGCNGAEPVDAGND